MIPVTYPSSVSAFNRRQMEIYPITPTASQIAWTDYIPVRFNSSQYVENTTDNSGYMAVNVLSSSTGKQAWVDYVPVVIDDNRADAWQISANGYIPVNFSGTGDGTERNKGLSLNFVGASTLDPRITFSRASNATVVGSNGLIQYAPHNLLTFSEQFDNAQWAKSTVTVTANNTTSPNGTTTADKVDATAGDSNIRQTATGISAGMSYTFSVYLKADTATNLTLFMVDGGGGSGNTSQAVSVTTEWQRFTVTRTTSASTTQLICQIGGASSFSTGESIYAWGAQLNVGSLQSYNSTTVKNLLGFSEAFDNAAWTKSNSFIQTNLLLQSEAFDASAWIKNAGTVTANATTAPNGTQTADLLNNNSTDTTHYFTQSLALADNTTYVYSVYLKAETAGFAYLRFRNKANSFTRSAYVDLSNGTFSSGNITGDVITDVGNGWYRVALVCESSSGATTPSVWIYVATANGDGGTVENVSLYAWGAQLVQGSVAGDYQQTTSSALPVMYQAPNGTMTADKFVESAGSVSPIVSQSVSAISGTPYTYSVYAKSAQTSPKRYLTILLPSTAFGSNRRVTFDLEAGTYVTTNSPTSASMTPVGNGWYRCQVTATASTTTSASSQIRLSDVSPDTLSAYTGDGTSGIYIWGAQLSDSASLDTYVNNPVAAPSSTAFYGARFDYDPVTLQPKGLLIEEQRSNLLLRSEEFDNASWSRSGIAGVTANATVSPDGTADADLVIPTATAVQHFVSQTVTGGAQNFSAYVKAGGYSSVILFFTVHNSYVTFNLATQTVTETSGTITSSSITDVGNGWYRVSVATSLTTHSEVRLYVTVGGTYATRADAGDGTSGIYMWGAQLEAGAFATSYIPTTTAQVTRSADVALVQGSNFSSWYNPNTSTIFTSTLVPFDSSSTAVGFTPTTGAFNDSAYLTTTPTADSWLVLIGGASQANINVGVTGARKSAATLALNDFALCANGGSVGTDTSGNFFAFNRLTIGCSPWNTDNQLNGWVRQVAYYPRRLQNSELQAITS